MNHAYVHTKANLKAPEIDDYLKKLVAQKWAGVVKVETRSVGNWHIDAVGFDKFPFSLSVWIASPRKLEMRKSFGDPSSWLQAFIRDHLAHHLKGKCGDECMGEKFKPQPAKFWNYEGWWREVYDRSKGGFVRKAFIDKLWQRDLKYFPVPLLGVK
jgi:hypothetical protein